jgi:hypothetical protein
MDMRDRRGRQCRRWRDLVSAPPRVDAADPPFTKEGAETGMMLVGEGGQVR